MLSASSHLQEVTCSFHKSAHIDFVAFTRVYDDSSLLDIADNQEIIEHFYYDNNEHYEDLAPDICPEMLIGEYFLIQCYDTNNPSLQYLHKDLSLSHVLTITKKYHNYHETFWFGSREESKFVNFFINNTDLFEFFIQAFKKEQKIKSLINACEADKMTRVVSNEVKIRNQNFINKYKTTFEDADVACYIQNQHYSPEKLTVNLTKREKDCLDWCAAGKTNEEIGLILQISRRTVDHYMESMKRKLDCINKVSLIRRAIQLKLIND